APPSACPVCGKKSLSKLISLAGFHLKGSGWYATDFKNSGAKPAVKSDAGKDAESKPVEANKSDAGKDGESRPAEAKSASQGDSKSATTGEATPAASPPATATVPDARERCDR